VIEFPKPINLNGAELLDELAAIGIVLHKYHQAPLIDGEGRFWLDVEEKDKDKVFEIVAAHNGNTVAPEPTVEEKLASVGLNLNDLKAALGL
jgi:hypothetical protein